MLNSLFTVKERFVIPFCKKNYAVFQDLAQEHMFYYHYINNEMVFTPRLKEDSLNLLRLKIKMSNNKLLELQEDQLQHTTKMIRYHNRFNVRCFNHCFR